MFVSSNVFPLPSFLDRDENNFTNLFNPITGIKVRDYSGDDLHTEHIDENRRSVTHFWTQVYTQWDKIILEITSILLSSSKKS